MSPVSEKMSFSQWRGGLDGRNGMHWRGGDYAGMDVLDGRSGRAGGSSMEVEFMISQKY